MSHVLCRLFVIVSYVIMIKSELVEVAIAASFQWWTTVRVHYESVNLFAAQSTHAVYKKYTLFQREGE